MALLDAAKAAKGLLPPLLLPGLPGFDREAHRQRDMRDESITAVGHPDRELRTRVGGNLPAREGFFIV